jgi:hypothetical protein
MPVGFGKRAVKSMGRPLSVMAHVKNSIIEVKAQNKLSGPRINYCHCTVTKDPNYEAYRKGRKILPEVQHLLQTTGIDLQQGGGVREIQQFQDHFKQ